MSVGKNSLDSKKLIGFIERIEVLKREQKDLGEEIKAIRIEAEREGFSAKGVTVALKARAQKPSQFREEEDVRDVYLHAIGMASPPPLFKHIESLAHDTLGRNQLIEHFKELVPAGAQITIEMGGGAPVRLFRDDQGNSHAEEVHPPKATVEKPREPGLPRAPAAEVPNCTPDEAEEMGAKAYEADQPITSNPFPFGDKRQPKWDAGWRKRSGSDGMGPDTGGPG